ncbi:hypothetical protein PR048_008582 [Dryococelus australis]|uniref:Uncharacterized protein n=1 Tax=Dryococelus australis TaxID=614101 RepID=A0ABQ9HZ97_9NEOP|nr:hypothetical protein PR048_008582 [Dryococelus australis]
MDDDIVVCGEQTDAQVVSSRVQSSRSSDEENEPSESPVQSLPTSVEIMEYIHALRSFELNKFHCTYPKAIMQSPNPEGILIFDEPPTPS